MSFSGSKPRDEASKPTLFGHDGSLYTDDENEILAACARYKAEHRKGFLSVTEIVWVMRGLGWEKRATPPRDSHGA